jgi:non-canonical purine NTP pyrophosphatase (RdgB/HAM1 family)
MERIEEIFFVTSNPGKAEYLKKFFDFPIKHLNLNIPEIQSLDLTEIVSDKARKAYREVKRPVLVEDISLIFNALNGLPGPFIKWFSKTLSNEDLCSLVSHYRDKTALAEVQFALCVNDKIEIFKGICAGTIAEKPRGENGFGWDPIFIPQGHNKTFAEMMPEEKHEFSMRKISLNNLKQYLGKIN